MINTWYTTTHVRDVLDYIIGFLQILKLHSLRHKEENKSSELIKHLHAGSCTSLLWTMKNSEDELNPIF